MPTDIHSYHYSNEGEEFRHTIVVKLRKRLLEFFENLDSDSKYHIFYKSPFLLEKSNEYLIFRYSKDKQIIDLTNKFMIKTFSVFINHMFEIPHLFQFVTWSLELDKKYHLLDNNLNMRIDNIDFQIKFDESQPFGTELLIDTIE